MLRKSIPSFILLTILAISLAACDNSGNTAQDTTTEAEDSTEDTEAAGTAETGEEANPDYSYTIVDTDQTWCFSDSEAVACGEVFVGQDAQYEGVQPAYQDNGDGTATDLNTGLMWIQDAGDRTYYADAMEDLETYTFAGYDDWRLPTIKELYSLALFSGVDASMASSSDVDGLWPLIDEDYFVFLYGDESGGQRVIDAQWLTSSIYVSTVNGDQSCFFGFNFSDGRIKCYRLEFSPSGGFFAQYVRGGDDYGVNDYAENGDDTITDNATGLTWTQNDSGEALDWDSSLNYCESLSLGDSDEWRLPNIKELHSLVDYGRSPDTTDSAAIDPLFNMTPIINEAGEADFGAYWSSTTLISYPSGVGAATYISFGRALGYQEQFGGWVDVHGAGAQRSDPKVPDDDNMYEFGHGPQGDSVRQYNYVLCVSGGVAEPSDGDDPSTLVLTDVEIEPVEGGGVPSLDGANTQEGPGAGAPDLTAAAATLGITEQELKDALGSPPPDFEAAAAALGISAEELEAALRNNSGGAQGGPPEQGAPPEEPTDASGMLDDSAETASVAYTINDTGQTKCYNDSTEIACPQSGEAFYGQDAQITGNTPSYTKNGDGTVTDNVTGLMWQQSPDLNGDGDIDVDDKLTYAQALAGADSFNLAGYSDWRLPTIKELYSLIDFRGLDPSGYNGSDTSSLVPFIDTDTFDFGYGDTSAEERIIDAQFATSTKYVSTTMNGAETMFGVNFADGRIKGYPTDPNPGQSQGKLFYVLYVRGNTDYGINDFVANGDSTITDSATGLMWSQDDSGSGLNWEESLAWVQQKNDENYLGYSDWRLPDAKELQSIVDYSRSPDTTGSAAIDPLFNVTAITNEANQNDYPTYWSSTTHANLRSGGNAAYVDFGRSMGYMNGRWIDVHGAGAQRSDPKSGDPDDWPTGHGPQGDAIRIYNYVRLVRDADATPPISTPTSTPTSTATTPPQKHSLYLPTILAAGAGAPPTSTATAVAPTATATSTIPPTDTATPLPTNTATPPATTNTASGYNLFAPLRETTTYLIDEEGSTVYTWPSSYRPGNAVYLLENGNLLRTGNTNSDSFNTGGTGGIVEEIAPNGNVVWSYTYDTAEHRLHHDIEPLPNGNVLLIAWELKTEAEAIAAGRNPNQLREGELWPDTVIEVNPDTNAIVWEWHVWDHLVQDHDASKANFGVVADHPELIDLNFQGGGSRPGSADWNHINSIDYNAEFDQIMLSVHGFSEIWVIDHSTTAAEAAGHSGGDSNMGGDLLYRWGNPQAYDAGNAGDQQLFVQHDAQWIPDGYPGAGNILVFNNGGGRADGDYSSVDEIVPPVDGNGNYNGYGPAAPVWSYSAPTPTDFYATNISSAQRLPNGNTLICDGPGGYFFEVTPAGEIVWDYDHGEQAIFRVTRYPADYAGLPVSTGQTQVP